MWFISKSLFVLALSSLTVITEAAPSIANANSTNVLAAQLGPYPVSIYDHEIKTLRPDPLAPTAQLRRFMITVYRPFLDNFTCPVEYQTRIPYIPSLVTRALFQIVPGILDPNDTTIFDSVQLINCSRPVPPDSSSGPLLLFGPGYGATRQPYAATLQAAASSGYTVIAIDSTYEAAAVVFPDGTVAYRSNVTDAYDQTLDGENFIAAVRTNDTISVLDAIERGEIPGFASYSGSNSTSTNSTAPLRAVMYGMSFGGSSAVNVALTDSRVIAAANIDGPFYGPASNDTVQKPLFMMSTLQDSLDFEPTWSTYYSHNVRGWKTWVTLSSNNTLFAHYGYTDLPLLADLLNLRGSFLSEDLTGTVDSRRLQEIIWRYTTAFFDYVWYATTSGLLEGPTEEFPDVSFRSHAEAETGRQSSNRELGPVPRSF